MEQTPVLVLPASCVIKQGLLVQWCRRDEANLKSCNVNRYPCTHGDSLCPEIMVLCQVIRLRVISSLLQGTKSFPLTLVHGFTIYPEKLRESGMGSLSSSQDEIPIFLTKSRALGDWKGQCLPGVAHNELTETLEGKYWLLGPFQRPWDLIARILFFDFFLFLFF